MIEIRELIIRTNVTQNATSPDKAPAANDGGKQQVALDELLKGLHDKNER